MKTKQTQIVADQVKVYGPKPISGWGHGALIKAEVRYDDRCCNGHNTLSITGTIYIPGRRDIEAGGCLHDAIAKHFPELEPFIKWHLVSTDGPMHYLSNTRYHLEQGKVNYAKSTAVYGALPEDSNVKPEDIDEQFLQNRLPALLSAFQTDVESLGFTY
jgi:hypothetical protein